MKQIAAGAFLLMLLGCADNPIDLESHNALLGIRAYNDFLARTLVQFESLRTEDERAQFANRLKSSLEVETRRYRKHVDGEKARGTLIRTSQSTEFQIEVRRLQGLANRVGTIIDKYYYGKKDASQPDDKPSSPPR